MRSSAPCQPGGVTLPNFYVLQGCWLPCGGCKRKEPSVRFYNERHEEILLCFWFRRVSWMLHSVSWALQITIKVQTYTVWRDFFILKLLNPSACKSQRRYVSVYCFWRVARRILFWNLKAFRLKAASNRKTATGQHFQDIFVFIAVLGWTM